MFQAEAVEVAVAQVKGYVYPTKAEQAAAYEILIELSTRTSSAHLASTDGTIREVLTSIDEMFGLTREILRRHGADTVKGRAILRDPRLALCVDDDRPPFSFVLVNGTATTSTDPAPALASSAAFTTPLVPICRSPRISPSPSSTIAPTGPSKLVAALVLPVVVVALAARSATAVAVMVPLRPVATLESRMPTWAVLVAVALASPLTLAATSVVVLGCLGGPTLPASASTTPFSPKEILA